MFFVLVVGNAGGVFFLFLRCLRVRCFEGVGERGEEKRGKVGQPGMGGKETSATSGGGERLEGSGGRGGPAAA
jgi:hypothetical protein